MCPVKIHDRSRRLSCQHRSQILPGARTIQRKGIVVAVRSVTARWIRHTADRIEVHQAARLVDQDARDASGRGRCASTGGADAPEVYLSDEIDVDNGTIRGREISALEAVDVRLRGLVKSKPRGSTVMYLSHDKNAFDPDSYRSCINLIIDKKLGFNSPVVRDFVFRGRFVLVERLDPSVMHLTYDGIGFDIDCQSFKKPDKYPYFFVKGFEKVG